MFPLAIGNVLLSIHLWASANVKQTDGIVGKWDSSPQLKY